MVIFEGYDTYAVARYKCLVADCQRMCMVIPVGSLVSVTVGSLMSVTVGSIVSVTVGSLGMTT